MLCFQRVATRAGQNDGRVEQRMNMNIKEFVDFSADHLDWAVSFELLYLNHKLCSVLHWLISLLGVLCGHITMLMPLFG